MTIQPTTPKTLPDPVTPRWQTGTWTLTAPDGRTWRADSPLKACSLEQRERVPHEVAINRIFAACDDVAAQPPAVAAIPEMKVNYSFVTLWLEENCKRIAWTPENAIYEVSDGAAYELVSAFSKQACAPQPPAGQQDRGEAFRKVGDIVTAKQAIFEPADDHAPGGYLCAKGDRLIIRAVNPSHRFIYSVSHENVTDRTFGASEEDFIAPATSGEAPTRELKAGDTLTFDPLPVVKVAGEATAAQGTDWVDVNESHPMLGDTEDDIEVWTWDGLSVREDEYGPIYEQPAGPEVGGWLRVGNGFAGDCIGRQATHWMIRTKPNPPGAPTGVKS